MFRFLLASSLCVSASATDFVTLNNGDLFKGEVIGLADDTIKLHSAHSSTPLRIIGSKLRHIRFDSGDLTENPTHSQVINLRNGDSLPGQVTGLNDSTLSFDTWFAGPLTVSREHVDSVYFGVTPQEVTYQGPKAIENWEQENREWDYYKGTLRANKRGPIGRDFGLSEDFIISTTITWINSPQLRIFLCSDLTSIDSERGSNNYLVTINPNGVEVKRQLSKEEQGSRYHSLISSKLNLNSFKSGKKELNIELRVNRREGIVHLYLNGEYIKQGVDPKTPPSGTCIIYESQSSNSRDMQIKNIVAKKWDTVTQNLRRESRADDESDTLATSDGDRFSGEITTFNLVDEREHLTVKSPLLREALPVPVEQCLALYFSRKDEQDHKRAAYKLAMHSGGSLSLNEVSLGGDKLEATHPALGLLKLDQRILSEITRNKKIIPTPEEDPDKTIEEEDSPSKPE